MRPINAVPKLMKKPTIPARKPGGSVGDIVGATVTGEPVGGDVGGDAAGAVEAGAVVETRAVGDAEGGSTVTGTGAIVVVAPEGGPFVVSAGVGREEGTKLAVSVGSEIGERLGTPEGVTDGIPDGEALGTPLGSMVEPPQGTPIGPTGVPSGKAVALVTKRTVCGFPLGSSQE